MACKNAPADLPFKFPLRAHIVKIVSWYAMYFLLLWRILTRAVVSPLGFDSKCCDPHKRHILSLCLFIEGFAVVLDLHIRAAPRFYSYTLERGPGWLPQGIPASWLRMHRLLLLFAALEHWRDLRPVDVRRWWGWREKMEHSEMFVSHCLEHPSVCQSPINFSSVSHLSICWL